MELVALGRILPMSTALLYVLRCLGHWRGIIATRHLYSADAAMKQCVLIRYYGVRFAIDCSTFDAMLPGDSPTFSGIREMFGRDVYLRGFQPRRMRLRTVVDAGGNRGLFSLWAASAGADTFWIECQRHYLEAARCLWDQNGVSNRVYPTVAALSVTTGESSLSVNDVVGYGARASLSLLKMDIEGAEFPIFAGDTGWLGLVENLTMEVHRSAGDPSDIIEVLRRAKFDVVATDDYFNPVKGAQATYIYASSVGALI